MSPKNAIKMINIQKSYLVHIVSIWSHQSSSVQFGPVGSYIWSILSTIVVFSPIIHSVHIGSIRSTLVLFCPLRFYSVHSVYFSSIRSILPTLFLFSPIQSTLVLFSPFCPLWSTSILFRLFNLLRFYSVHFGSIRFD